MRWPSWTLNGNMTARPQARRPCSTVDRPRGRGSLKRGGFGGKTFRKPFKFSKAGEPDAVYIRTRHIMDHLVECNWLRDNWHGMPIRSDRVLKRELRQAGVLLLDDGKEAVERTVNGQRVSHMVGISLAALQASGIDATKARQIVLDPVLL